MSERTLLRVDLRAADGRGVVVARHPENRVVNVRTQKGGVSTGIVTEHADVESLASRLDWLGVAGAVGIAARAWKDFGLEDGT